MHIGADCQGCAAQWNSGEQERRRGLPRTEEENKARFTRKHKKVRDAAETRFPRKMMPLIHPYPEQACRRGVCGKERYYKS